MLKNLKLSLAGMLGSDYIDKVIEANCFFDEAKREEFKKAGYEEVEFYPDVKRDSNSKLAERIGEKVIDSFENDNMGANSTAFQKAFNKNSAPVSGRGCYRIGEDGRIYFVGKSEHYHSSLGHGFDGYKLIDNARKLNILNATHNNTRGYITRLLERELIKAANGAESEAELAEVLASTKPHVLNRVISLETGSLAVEAAIKMMLNRFYEIQGKSVKYADRIPVFFVMGDYSGGTEANYHGTTIFAQTLRNMWNDFYKKEEAGEVYKVVPVKINDIDDFKKKIEEYNKPPYKTAGFMHEIVLMNYGGILLEKAYLQAAHALCREYDTPTLVDEIQSCVWYKELFLFKKYELTPDFVIIGKGFSGGESPASKVITTAEMDTLIQFGALVTNGQEELASLAYLITMKFVQFNGIEIEENQAYFFNALCTLAEKYPDKVKSGEGLGYLAAIVFNSLDLAKQFAIKVNEQCIDVSAQTYKLHCPAAVLLKLPLIVSKEELDILIKKFETILELM